MSDVYVMHTSADFAEVFANLLPHGPAWPRDADGDLMLIVEGLAGVWGDVATAADQLLSVESFPTTTLNMLPDWERNFGLPDDCVAEPLTLYDRRVALVTRLTMLGAQDRQFFINLAASIGYSVTITEYSPFMCGISRCGDTTAQNPDDPTRMRWQIGAPEMRFYWSVRVSGLRLSYFHCGAGECGVDPLLSIGLATDLECLLRRYKPGHTEVLFDYSPVLSLDFSQVIDSGYLVLGIP